MSQELTFHITDQERRLLRQLLNNYWHDLDQQRMLSRPDSPQETALLADQIIVEGLQGNLK